MVMPLCVHVAARMATAGLGIRGERRGHDNGRNQKGEEQTFHGGFSLVSCHASPLSAGFIRMPASRDNG
jgi:hypothetical protein